MPSLLDQLSQHHPNHDPRIVQTKDDSYTVLHPGLQENYHSLNGARQESEHVYIQNGLKRYIEVCPEPTGLSIMEVGFGTGLNLFLCSEFLNRHALEASYQAIEPFPLPGNILEQVNEKNGFVHQSTWQQFINFYEYAEPEISNQLDFHCELPNISFDLYKTSFICFHGNEQFDLIFYDAFSPASQPEMWDHASLTKIAELLKTGGMMVTYCIRGYIKRTFQDLGLLVQALPGAKGKREMLRVIKPAR